MPSSVWAQVDTFIRLANGTDKKSAAEVGDQILHYIVNNRPTIEYAEVVENLLNAAAEFLEKNLEHTRTTLGRVFLHTIEVLALRNFSGKETQYVLTTNVNVSGALFAILENNCNNLNVISTWSTVMSRLLSIIPIHQMEQMEKFEKCLSLAVTCVAKQEPHKTYQDPSTNRYTIFNVSRVELQRILAEYNYYCRYEYFLTLENCTKEEMEIHIGSIDRIEDEDAIELVIENLNSLLEQLYYSDIRICAILHALARLCQQSNTDTSYPSFVVALNVAYKLLESENIRDIITAVRVIPQFLQSHTFFGMMTTKRLQVVTALVQKHIDELINTKHNILSSLMELIDNMFLEVELEQICYIIAERISLSSSRENQMELVFALLNREDRNVAIRYPNLVTFALNTVQNQYSSEHAQKFIARVLSRPLEEIEKILTVEQVQWIKDLTFRRDDMRRSSMYFPVINALAKHDSLLLIFEQEKLTSYMHEEFMSVFFKSYRGNSPSPLGEKYDEKAFQGLLLVFQIFFESTYKRKVFEILYLDRVLDIFRELFNEPFIGHRSTKGLHKAVCCGLDLFVIFCDLYEERVMGLFCSVGAEALSRNLNENIQVSNERAERYLATLDDMLQKAIHQGSRVELYKLAFVETNPYETRIKKRINNMNVYEQDDDV